MSLNLKELLPEDEVIQFDKYKFKIPYDIPIDTLLQLDVQREKLTIFNDDKVKKEDIKAIYDSIRKLLKEILYLKNVRFFWQKKKIDRFIDDLGYKSLIKVVTFLSEYINQDMDVKKNDLKT